MKLAFSIALRFLKSSKGQTLLIALGIAIGVSVQIFIGSLIQGLQKSLVDTTIGSQPQITIKSNSDDKLIKDYAPLLDKVANDFPGVKYVSPAADGPALITANDKNYSILVRGLSFDAAEGIYKIRERLVEGSLPTKQDEVLIGTNLQQEAGVRVGDEITALTNLGAPKTMTVTGIFDLQVASLNNSWVLTNLATAQSLFTYDQQITGVEMQVADVFTADTDRKSVV